MFVRGAGTVRLMNGKLHGRLQHVFERKDDVEKVDVDMEGSIGSFRNFWKIV